MCFVLGRIRGDFANSSAPLLSSNSFEWHLISGIGIDSTLPNSFRSDFIGIRSRKEVDNAMYSASVVDKAISVCILECHNIGHPKYLIMYPVRL